MEHAEAYVHIKEVIISENFTIMMCNKHLMCTYVLDHQISPLPLRSTYWSMYDPWERGIILHMQQPLISCRSTLASAMGGDAQGGGANVSAVLD